MTVTRSESTSAREHRILVLSQQISALSEELSQLLLSPPSSPSPPRRPLTELVVGDIVEITVTYGGFRGQQARILDLDSRSVILELLSNGQRITKRKTSVRKVL